MTLDEYVGQQIARVRTQAGMSVATLAARLHITESQLIAYEAGQEKMGADLLSEMGFIFKISYLELFPKQETIPQISQLDQELPQDITLPKETKH